MPDHDDVAPLQTVPSVDLPRYAGLWYEIARLPIRQEDRDASDVTAHYALQDNGKVRVVNRCINGEGKPEEAEGEATPVDDSNAKLEVSFLPAGLRWVPFARGDYWILRLDADYATALVGTPDRKYLWLLSRRPVMNEMARRDWLAFAEAHGFDLGEVIHTPQTGRSTAPAG